MFEISSSKSGWYWAGLVVAALAFIYVTLRALFVPPFSDEITTFFQYIRPGDLQPYFAHLDANNHVFNSLLGRLSYLAFGESWFALRLPNVLAFVGYLVYLFKFRSHYRNDRTWFLWLILMTVPMYLMSFFHLCRGYGLSLAFLLIALYHLLEYFEDSKNSDLLIGMVCLALGLWSNLAIMISALTMAGLFFLKFCYTLFTSDRSRAYKGFGVFCLIIFAIPTYYAAEYSLFLKESGKLYHGADGDFYINTIVRLVFQFTQSWPVSEFVCIFIGISFLMMIARKKGNLFLSDKFILVPVIGLSSVIGILLLHELFAVKFPIDRATVHLYAFFLTSWFLASESIKSKIWWPIVLLPTLLLAWPSVTNLNFTHTPHWKNEMIPYSYYEFIKAYDATNELKTTVSARTLPLSTFEYYDYKNGGVLNVLTEPEFPSSIADFVILNEPIVWDGRDNYDVVKYEPSTGCTLLLRKEPVGWVKRSSVIEADVVNNGGYFNLARCQKSQMNMANVKASVAFDISCDSYIKDLHLVFAIKDAEGNYVKYQRCNLQFKHPEINGIKHIESSCVFEKNSDTSNEVSVFIWNVEEIPMEIHKSSVDFYSL